MHFSKLFFKYLAKYLAFLLLAFSITVPIATVAYQSVRQQCLDEKEATINEGLRVICENINKMTLIRESTQNNTAFRQLCRENGTISPNNVMYIKDARDYLYRISMAFDFPRFYFALYNNVDAFMSYEQCTIDFSEKYYGDFFSVTVNGVEQDAEYLKSMLFAKEANNSFIFADDVLCFEGKKKHLGQSLIYIDQAKIENMQDVYYALIYVFPVEDIISCLVKEEFVDSFYLAIKNIGDDSLIFEHGEVGKEYIVNAEDSNLGWKVTVGIPKDCVKDYMRGISITMLAYILIEITVWIFISVILARRDCKHMKRMLEAVGINEKDAGNEYEILLTNITQLSSNRYEYEERIKTLQEKQTDMMLRNLLMSNHTDNDLIEYSKLINEVFDSYCVADVMLYGEKDDCQIVMLSVLDFMKSNANFKSYHVQMGPNEVVFVINLKKITEPNVDGVISFFRKLTDAVRVEKDIVFNIGISAIGIGLNNIHTSYNQAKQVINIFDSQDRTFIERFDINLLPEKRNMVTLDSLSKLKEILLSGDNEAINSFFEKLIRDFNINKASYEHCKDSSYYSIANIIKEVNSNIDNLTTFEELIPPYDEKLLFADSINILYEACLKVSKAIGERRKNHNDKLKNEVILYIEQNYSNAALNAACIAKDVGISERYLAQYVKEQTGQTLASYIEKVRLDHAKELLIKTELSNENIAIMTGFGATNSFYRVFNKIIGVSPKVFRQEHINE